MARKRERNQTVINRLHASLVKRRGEKTKEGGKKPLPISHIVVKVLVLFS